MFPTPRRYLIGTVLLICVTGGCLNPGELPDPSGLPQRAEALRSYGTAMTPIDLDRDGWDEFVYRYRPTHIASDSHNAVVLTHHDLRSIDQLNYDGRVEPPEFVDLDGDGMLELVVPVVRNDSLFYSIAGRDGRKQAGFLVTAGMPRREPDGVLAWDPRVRDIYAIDVDGDGRRDLVSVIVTEYARAPRGVFVHSLPNGELMGKLLVGAGIYNSVLVEAHEDSLPVLVMGAGGSRNGAVAGGLDDERAYLLRVRLGAQPELIDVRETGGAGTITVVEFGNYDADGRDEVLAVSFNFAGSPNEPVTLLLIDPQTWTPKRHRELRLGLTSPVTIDLDRDARREILMSASDPGAIYVFDGTLDTIIRRSVGPRTARVDFAVRLAVWPDADGDGIGEIEVRTGNGELLLLTPDLRPKARIPSPQILGVFHSGPEAPPELIVAGPQGSSAIALRPNRWHLILPYRLEIAVVLGFALVAAMIAWIFAMRMRYRLAESVRSFALDDGRNDALLLDRGGTLVWMNERLRRKLGITNRRSRRRQTKDLANAAPDLVAFCRDASAAVPSAETSGSVSVTNGGNQSRMKTTASPVLAGVPGDPHWLVRLQNQTGTQPDETATWAMMAQRVAHSLKNPLTSILLTLQRLQMEYRERAPAVANRLDRYSTRIEERIEELRQLTRNFLKFVDLEAPELSDVDFNALVTSFADSTQRTMPPDIRLNTRIAADLPTIVADREQLFAVLDNLVANAVNAMPEGGVITLSTRRARQVPFNHKDAGREYIEFEILDTGSGIPDGIRPRLFEPGFSTAEEGSGLGLAIVKKIVEDHGGTVMLQSEVETGTAFSVFLPIRSA